MSLIRMSLSFGKIFHSAIVKVGNTRYENLKKNWLSPESILLRL